MSSLGAFWRWWADSWRVPRRARLTYVAMSLGFGALAIAGAIRGDAVVVAVGGAVAVVVVGLAVAMPWLAQWTGD